MILGGTGFVGRHLCEKLVRQGWHVTVPTRRRSQASHLQHLPSLRAVELNVHDQDLLTQALQGHQAVVNLVAILHGNEEDFWHVHVGLTKKLAQACLENRISKVVHISALGADADSPQLSPSYYLRSKGLADAYWISVSKGEINTFDLNILRPSVIFGAEDQFLNVFADLQRFLPFVPLAGANAKFQPVWVEDVAEAVIRSLSLPIRQGYRLIELCGPDIFTLKDLVILSAQLSGVRGGKGRPVWPVSYWVGCVQARLMNLAPGKPLMSRDNLDSMSIDNISTQGVPGLLDLGIVAAPLKSVAFDYLRRDQTSLGLVGMRLRAKDNT